MNINHYYLAEKMKIIVLLISETTSKAGIFCPGIIAEFSIECRKVQKQ